MNNKAMKNRITTYVLLGVSLILMIAGVWQKQNLSVLNKAIKICLECVGIG